MGYLLSETPYPHRYIVGFLYIIFAIIPLVLHLPVVKALFFHPTYRHQYAYRIMAWHAVFELVMQAVYAAFGVFLVAQNVFHDLFETFVSALFNSCWYGIYLNVAFLAFNRCTVTWELDPKVAWMNGYITGFIWLLSAIHLAVGLSPLAPSKFWLDVEELKSCGTWILLAISLAAYLITVVTLLHKHWTNTLPNQTVISKNEFRILLQGFVTFLLGSINQVINFKSQDLFGLDSIYFIASMLVMQLIFGLLNPGLYLIINRDLKKYVLNFLRLKKPGRHVQVRYKASVTTLTSH
ncbi:hypothetical protein QR680_003533 [Steinernema hermaphroditum]|uniref:7TM GPCR serpentine receptor class x (Srx) domain-containing protein n=1 Tax=Steinernema hermaphroditum TaxID=289476 RepID=A0AA39LSI4_9BILA|nr:hypothetical protein QR680_003533 [Steinernema hermaphroditum]